jgi:predicted ATPase
MLTSLRIENFKSWRDTGEIRLAPLTVIFGANSSGKSSLGHLLLALKQTALSTDRRRALHLGDEGSLIDLGTFQDCIHNHDLRKTLGFQLGWKLPRALEISDPVGGRVYSGDSLFLSAKISAGPADQPVGDFLSYKLMDDGQLVLGVDLQQAADRNFQLVTKEYALERNPGRPRPSDAPEKFYRISDQTRAGYKNADFLADLALEAESALGGIHYLGPLRDHPKRLYQWSGDSPEDVGQRGELTIPAILAAEARGRRLSPGYWKRQKGFAELIAYWLKEIGIIHDFSVKQIAKGRKEFEVLVKTHGSGSEAKITDVGFGVSQVLPVLVQAFYALPHSTIWMEQPEIHLHPQVQAELADVFISAIYARENGTPRATQLILESHSEHFLNRLQRRIAEGAVNVEDVAIYFATAEADSSRLEALRVNAYGEIENWPENFFGDEMGELAAFTAAAMQRKIGERDAGAS